MLPYDIGEASLHCVSCSACGYQAWERLVTGYPETATATYRHTWAWTGWDGEWLVPRWPAVAADWDGVHLSVAGYLSTAGRLLPAGSARTLLAGWNPDETYWLADVIASFGEAQAWYNPSRDPLGWKMRKNNRLTRRPDERTTAQSPAVRGAGRQLDKDAAVRIRPLIEGLTLSGSHSGIMFRNSDCGRE